MGTPEEQGIERDDWALRVTSGMAAGSDSAFREFFDAYFDRIFRQLLWLTRGQEDAARELTQQVLVKVARHAQPFDHEARLWGWVKQIARRCHIDSLRRAGARREDLLLELTAEPAAPAPDDADAPWFEALDASLAELEPEELRVIQRAYFDRAPQQSIAADSRTTRKAVESRLARVRQKLRRLILQRLKDHALL